MTPETEESVNIQIDRRYYGHWTEVQIELGIDSFSTVTFSAPFEPARVEFRKTFRPFTYQDVEVDTHLETLFHGFMVNVEPRFDANGSTVQVSCYARPAVLGDCTLPWMDETQSPPVPQVREFKKFTPLSQIARSVCRPFGIGVELAAPEGKGFDKVRIAPEKNIHEFLCDLARQRNLVLGNTVEGKLLIWQSIDVGKPVARFGVPLSGDIKTFTPIVEAQFSPQAYFSEISGLVPKKKAQLPGRWTESNPWLKKPVRTHTFKLEDTERGDAPEATKARMGRMFANMVTYTLSGIPSWRTPSGELWRPNTTVELLAPDAMVYRKTEFLIRRVILKTNKDATTATLELCLPGAFNGKVPGRLPWEELTEGELAAAHFLE